MTEWRILDWLADYAISECGDVKRARPARNQRAGRLLAVSPASNGYYRVGLTIDGKVRMLSAHRLVCEAWHGPPPTPAHQAAHKDGSRDNNHYTNLRWLTPLENAADKFAHGTILHGERNPNATTTLAQVSAIRAGYIGRYGDKIRLARENGVSYDVVCDILRGRSWNRAPLLAQVAG